MAGQHWLIPARLAWEKIGLCIGDVRGLLLSTIREPAKGVLLELGNRLVLRPAISAGWAAAVAVMVVAMYWVYMLWPVRLVRHIKCPPYWLPGLGHLPLLGKKESQIFIDLAAQYGPVYRFHFGRQPIVMIADAEFCRQICTKFFKSATDRANPAYIETVPLLQHALFFSRGKAWSSMRNTVLPFYHSEQMRKYVPLMNRIVNVLVQLLKGKSEKDDVNFSQYLMMLTLDVIGATAFGANFETLQGLSEQNDGKTSAAAVRLDAKLVKAANSFINSLRLDGNAPVSTIIGELFPFLQQPMRKLLGSIPGTADWEMEEQTGGLMRVLKEMLKQREAEENVDRRIDMLSLLLNARKEKSDLTDDCVNGLSFEILLVGSETTAVTLSNCLYFVACHPQVEQKILEEVDAFGPPRDISFDDLNKFPYVEQVFKETLRFCTPAPVIARLITDDIKLGEYKIKKGTHVWLTPNAVMMDSRYFKNPHEFNPDRFSPDCPENKERHPSAYMPFGLGARACIGTRFSTQEAKIALIKLYQHFTFTHSPTMENPLAFNFGIVRRPKHGIKLRVHPRF
ncbi:hypothetical protein GOP47_0005583 [Adiantum capillus-veneris]|uniref:Cytochrome P450 n=1 Tax=Adiantum capillus-veneris TaxID=13818 RepID=A0A9D4V5T9_ADICA|nr:hypothetical protein GOP47_0005583 [Adiantum capillus-veneris]